MFSLFDNEEKDYVYEKSANYIALHGLLKDALNGRMENFAELNRLMGNPKDFDFFALNTGLVKDLMAYADLTSAAFIVSGPMGLGKCVSTCFIAAKWVASRLYVNKENANNSEEVITKSKNTKDQQSLQIDKDKTLNKEIFTVSEIELDILRRIIMNIYPDVFFLNAHGDISVEMAVEMRKFISTPPLLSKCKVVIINNAYRLNNSSSNALLKELEELKNNVYIFFITPNKYLLLNTIISRCFSINVNPNTGERLDAYLKTFREFNIMESVHKDMFISYIKNSPGKAKNILSNALVLSAFLRLYSVFTIHIPDKRMTDNYQTKDEIFVSKIVGDLLKYDVDLSAIEDFILYVIGLPSINNIRNETMEKFANMKERCLKTFLSIRTLNVDKKSFIVSLVLYILYSD